MTPKTGGEAIVEALIANDVDTVFGLPGAQLDPVFAALHDRANEIRVIHSRHEQGCAYMAFGYAAATGKTGVAMVVPGPGLLNAGAAIVTAYACHAPMLVLSGQLRAAMIGKGFGALHEINDQFGVARTLVKWAGKIMHPDQAAGQVARALTEMRHGRVRPAYLEAPFDVVGMRAEVGPSIRADANAAGPSVDAAQVATVAGLLAAAKRPLIIAGGGSVDAGRQILALAERVDAPIVLTQNGLGAIDSRNPRVFTQAGGYHLWKDADLVVAFGTRLVPVLQTYGRAGLRIVKIDIDPEELVRLPPPIDGVLGDAAAVAASLTHALGQDVSVADAGREQWLAAARQAVADELARVAPQVELLAVIRDALGEDGILVSDLTQLYFVSQDGYPVYKPRSYIQPSYQGTLGHAAATSLGVKVGHPDKRVLCLAGDGGFMFTVQELATAAQHNIGTVFLVMNDNAFGNVKRILNENYGGRVISADLQNPDFVKLSESFGIPAERVDDPAGLRAALERAFARGGPGLVEYAAPEYPSPWHLLQRKPVR
jgi:acetolactate synthase I/II/III large subunit